MSGHSKWSTIKRQKQANDAKRGQSFTRLSNAITIAAREGGGNPEGNIKLQFAIEKAREASMPKDNIQRAIDRGTGKLAEGEAIQTLTYEGYGPGGVAIMVEAVTDNRQRTAAEMKNAFDRSGGTLGGPGTVAYMFKKVGLIIVKTAGKTEDEMLSIGLDAGAEEIEYGPEETEIYTKPEDLIKAKQSLEAQNCKIVEAELNEQATTTVPITDVTKAKQLLHLIESLEENDSVQKVYVNADIPQELVIGS